MTPRAEEPTTQQDEEIPQEEETTNEEGEETSSAVARRSRRTPEEMDGLRAQMMREGYPLANLTQRENDRVWVSLTQKRRRPQVQALLRMTDEAIDERVKAISAKHYELTGRK